MVVHHQIWCQYPIQNCICGAVVKSLTLDKPAVDDVPSEVRAPDMSGRAVSDGEEVTASSPSVLNGDARTSYCKFCGRHIRVNSFEGVLINHRAGDEYCIGSGEDA